MGTTTVALRFVFFFFNDTATTEIYTLSLHDALPIYRLLPPGSALLSRFAGGAEDGLQQGGGAGHRVFPDLLLFPADHQEEAVERPGGDVLFQAERILPGERQLRGARHHRVERPGRAGLAELLGDDRAEEGAELRPRVGPQIVGRFVVLAA